MLGGQVMGDAAAVRRRCAKHCTPPPQLPPLRHAAKPPSFPRYQPHLPTRLASSTTSHTVMRLSSCGRSAPRASRLRSQQKSQSWARAYVRCRCAVRRGVRPCTCVCFTRLPVRSHEACLRLGLVCLHWHPPNRCGLVRTPPHPILPPFGLTCPPLPPRTSTCPKRPTRPSSRAAWWTRCARGARREAAGGASIEARMKAPAEPASEHAQANLHCCFDTVYTSISFRVS